MHGRVVAGRPQNERARTLEEDRDRPGKRAGGVEQTVPRLACTRPCAACSSPEAAGADRAKRGSGTDAANRFLDHGNYLAYGLAASATWVLGLPHGLAVLHGKTRRGGLVFDVADLVKDAHILPQAFVSAMRGDDEAAFRRACIEQLTQTEALDFMIDTLKDVALKTATAAATTVTAALPIAASSTAATAALPAAGESA